MNDAQKQTWLEELYLRYRTKVFRLCLVILRETHTAEDAMQEVYLKARQSRRLPPKEKELTWLLTIARNTAYDLLRKQKREVSMEQEEIARLLDETAPVQPESSLEYLSLLEGLNSLDRDIVSLHIVGGLTHRETAALLRMTVHSVKKRYERAIQTLRKRYEEESL